MKVARDNTAHVTPMCINGKRRSGASQALAAVGF